ncbi:MAG: hypothetical protein R6V75_07025 [Bacteroidales bacterium]
MNPHIECAPLPVDIVFHPSWWYHHAGITFDEDFFYHPRKRVESERKMEEVLYERFGEHGLGADRHLDQPVIGAVHNAAGYLLSEMLGCQVVYAEDSAPLVIPAGRESLDINPDDAFRSPSFKKLMALREELKKRFGYLAGDVNWGGVLNIALDLAGQEVLTGLMTDPQGTAAGFRQLASVIERFVSGIGADTGTTSISVNRNVRHIRQPVFLHSECSHTMISTSQYDELLLPVDQEWSRKYRPFGVHYCGSDPHRFAASFSKIPHLDFLDVGWGGDVKELRRHLPGTFLNIRLDPVNLNQYDNDELASLITTLVEDSGDPWLTGVCCVNMDDRTEDEKIQVIFRTIKELRKRLVE